DTTERLEQRSELRGWNAKDFDIDVRRCQPKQLVAHPAADDKRTSALSTNCFGNRYTKFQRHQIIATKRERRTRRARRECRISWPGKSEGSGPGGRKPTPPPRSRGLRRCIWQPPCPLCPPW